MKTRVPVILLFLVASISSNNHDIKQFSMERDDNDQKSEPLTLDPKKNVPIKSTKWSTLCFFGIVCCPCVMTEYCKSLCCKQSVK